MTTTEELQARLEYVEAILAAQTAVLAPHLNALPPTSALVPIVTDEQPTSAIQAAFANNDQGIRVGVPQTDLDALKAFYNRQSSAIVASLGGSGSGQVNLTDSHQSSEFEEGPSVLLQDRNYSANLSTSQEANQGRMSHPVSQPLSLPGHHVNSTSPLESYPQGPIAKRVRYAVDSMAIERDMGGSSSSMGGKSLAQSAEILAAHPIMSWSVPREGELVPPELMSFLIEEYFSRVHPFLPVLHPPTFFSALSVYNNSITSNGPSSGVQQNRGLTSDGSSFIIEPAKLRPILHGIVAATLNFVDENAGSGRTVPAVQFLQGEGRKKELMATAYESVVMEAVDKPSFEVLQALLIVVVASIGRGSPPFAWGLAGMMSRTSVLLGINREATSFANDPRPAKEIPQPFQPFVLPSNFLALPRDKIEAEHRRRVFWLIFMVDRICAAGTGWSVALNRRDFSLDLPCSDHLWDNGIATSGRQPSSKSAFRWGPDASVSEESDSPRLVLWKGGEPGHTPTGEVGPGNAVRLPDGDRPASSAVPGSVTTSKLPLPGISGTPGPVARLANEARATLSSEATQTEPLGPFACLTEAFEGLSQVLAFLQQPSNMANFHSRLKNLADLDASLKAWNRSLPEEIQQVLHFDMLGISHVSPTKAMIHAVSIATTICLHQTFAYPAVEFPPDPSTPSTTSSAHQYSSPSDTVASSKVTCRLAAEAMDALLSSIMIDMTRMNLFMAFFIFISGRVRLVEIAHEKEPRDLKAEMETHMMALRQLGTVWGLGNYFADALEMGCSFIDATSNSLLPDGAALGLFDLRISAFSSRIFVASSSALASEQPNGTHSISSGGA